MGKVERHAVAIEKLKLVQLEKYADYLIYQISEACSSALAWLVRSRVIRR